MLELARRVDPGRHEEAGRRLDLRPHPHWIAAGALAAGAAMALAGWRRYGRRDDPERDLENLLIFEVDCEWEPPDEALYASG